MDLLSEILPSEALEAQEHEEMQGASTAWTVQHTLFPAARLFLQPPTKFATNGTILQVSCCVHVSMEWRSFAVFDVSLS